MPPPTGAHLSIVVGGQEPEDIPPSPRPRAVALSGSFRFSIVILILIALPFRPEDDDDERHRFSRHPRPRLVVLWIAGARLPREHALQRGGTRSSLSGERAGERRCAEKFRRTALDHGSQREPPHAGCCLLPEGYAAFGAAFAAGTFTTFDSSVPVDLPRSATIFRADL